MRHRPGFFGVVRQAAAVMLLAGGAAAGASEGGYYRVLAAGSSVAGTPAGAPAVTETQRLSAAELEALVGPVALYPDDLLAIVLPASAYPLQIVQAARFLDELDRDPTLKPRDDWDESVIALLNYPEVLKRMSEDLDRTWELGRAVLTQQEDVLAAVARFRRGAHTAGNLQSDDRQQVTINADVVEIRPADPKVIYVPRYEPAQVRVFHAAPVVHYYPRPYPVYYYPYPPDFPFGYFGSRVFWGVTSVFTIGWPSSRVHYYLHQHRRHPYYGRSYHPGYYYWRPRTIHHHYHYYGRHQHSGAGRHPDYWHPRQHRLGPRPLPYDHARHRDRGRKYEQGREYYDHDRQYDHEQRAGSRRHGRDPSSPDQLGARQPPDARPDQPPQWHARQDTRAARFPPRNVGERPLRDGADGARRDRSWGAADTTHAGHAAPSGGRGTSQAQRPAWSVAIQQPRPAAEPAPTARQRAPVDRAAQMRSRSGRPIPGSRAPPSDSQAPGTVRH